MKIKKKHFYLGIVGILILVVLSLYLLVKPTEIVEEISEPTTLSNYIDDDGFMLLPVRDKVNYDKVQIAVNDKYTISKVVYQSAKSDIYGLLVVPNITGLMPGVMLLPGAGVNKDSELSTAIKIASLGYVVLTIDLRGVGETGGESLTFEEDFRRYMDGFVSIQHLMILDALVGADVLTTLPQVDGSKLIIAGESLGGRIAIIAGAIDDRIKGVMAISSAGFDFKGGIGKEQDKFFRSLDPDIYVGKIAPRKFVMIHNEFDKNIGVEKAEITFSKANDPKLLILLNETTCNHGFCDPMLPAINATLEYISS